MNEEIRQISLIPSLSCRTRNNTQHLKKEGWFIYALRRLKLINGFFSFYFKIYILQIYCANIVLNSLKSIEGLPS